MTYMSFEYSLTLKLNRVPFLYPVPCLSYHGKTQEAELKAGHILRITLYNCQFSR